MTAIVRMALPAAEPLSVAEVKAHLRVTGNEDDTLLASLITAARLVAEDYTRRAFMTQGWRLWLDAFPCDRGAWWDGVREDPSALTITRSINLPRPPLQAVTLVQSYNDNNDATVFASGNYFVDTAHEPGRLALRSGASWPMASRSANGISIDFTAGYGAASDVPQPIRQGMLAHIAQLYEQRGDGFALAGQSGAIKALPEITVTLYAPYVLRHLGGSL